MLILIEGRKSDTKEGEREGVRERLKGGGGARSPGQLTCLPDLSGLPQTLWPEVRMWVFPVAAQVHKGIISVYWWQRAHGYW